MKKEESKSEKETRRAWNKMCEEITFYVRNVHQANKIIKIVGDFCQDYTIPHYLNKEQKPERKETWTAKPNDKIEDANNG